MQRVRRTEQFALQNSGTTGKVECLHHPLGILTTPLFLGNSRQLQNTVGSLKVQLKNYSSPSGEARLANFMKRAIAIRRRNVPLSLRRHLEESNEFRQSKPNAERRNYQTPFL